MDTDKESIRQHKKHQGKFAISSKMPIKNKKDLSIAYTPGVGAVSSAIAKNPKLSDTLTSRRNMVAVVTDGSAVLGLGNLGPLAATPVMEGKAILFKQFAGIDAVPIMLGTQEPEEIIATIKNIASSFGGINLEDISAPRCFEIEERLVEELDIPVFHDDQHGTGIVVLAALSNALKLVGKKSSQVRVVVSGSGAAGIAIAKLLHKAGFANCVMLDRQGIISNKRRDLTPAKKELLKFTNPKNLSGGIEEALVDADVFIGVSGPGLLKPVMIETMSDRPIIFALANPVPEIMPQEAKSAGAFIVASGRSDFPNQINNVLVFPGFFRGLLDLGISKVTDEMKLAVSRALASVVKKPAPDSIIPSVFDKKVVPAIVSALAKFS